MAILAIGGILVAALVVWALTRTVQTPATNATDSTVATDLPAGSPAVAEPLTTAPLTGTQTPPAQQSLERESNSVPRIAAEDLREQMNRGEVTVIDVRDAGSYASGHIPGSMHIAFANVEAAIGEIPRDKPIVTYCT